MFIHEFNSTEEAVLKAVRQSLHTQGLDGYIIGGYVRDRVLNIPTKDIDIVVVGDGISVAIATSIQLGIPKPTIFKRFGTAMIQFEGLEIEFVGARKESYSPDSRKPSVLEGTLEDDQLRRDFTVNAMAIRINEPFGELVDPFDGIGDLNKRIIRTPLDPDKTYSDDPLRMLRAIRFATQLDFDIDQSSLEGIARNKDRITIISQERITTEFNKILKAPIPSKGFIYLLETGLIDIIFPEMKALCGVDYVQGRGHKDNYFHTLEVLDNVALVSSDLWLRWAALLHDIAKPPTKRWDAQLGWTFHGHETLGAKWVPKIFRRFKLPLDKPMLFVQKLVLLHLRPISLTKDNITDSAIRRLLFDAGEDIDALMQLCHADVTTKNDSKKHRYRANYAMVKAKMAEIEEKDRLRNWEPPISGEVIMARFGLEPSRIVGDIKEAIREAILDGLIPNEYNAALAYMLEIGAKMGLQLDAAHKT